MYLTDAHSDVGGDIMDFYSGQDLLDLCQKEKISISSAMKQREITMGSLSAEEIQAKTGDGACHHERFRS